MPHPEIAQAIALIRSQKLEEAEALCRAVLERDPDDFSALQTLCHLLIAKDQREPAERILDNLRARSDLSALERTDLARRNVEAGWFSQAFELLEADTDPRDPQIPWARGTVLEHLGEYPAATIAYEQAASRDSIFQGVGERLRKLREHVARNNALGAEFDRIGRFIAQHRGDAILTGPFRGMHFAPGTDFHWACELVGSYEQELHPIIEGLIPAGHKTILNIGTSGGYYAVGMALRCPQATIIGFEMLDDRRAACAELAERNHVADRVQLRGLCTRADLAAVDLSPRTLIISDCEAAELDLLYPAAIPALRQADILVEVHDFLLPRLEQRLIARFAPTHAITRITAIAPEPDSYAAILPFLTPNDRIIAVGDTRPPGMTWLMMHPISKSV